jgi:hypothetical protein
LESSLDFKIPFHAYWYGEFGSKQAFCLKSFLCTQDLNKVHVILWLDHEQGFNGYESNQYLKDIIPLITIKCYSVKEEAFGIIPIEQIDEIFTNKDLVHKSDAFRLIILAKHGGVYFDLDIMFLRDLSQLLEKEFCYAWETQPYANTAILSLSKGGNTVRYLLKKSKKLMQYHPRFTFNYSDKMLSNLLVYPCTFFDPLWMEKVPSYNELPLNKFSDFFRKFDNEFHKKPNINSFKDFFKGCFTYHWHNQWDVKEYQNSYFGLFSKEFNELFLKNRQ